MRAHEFITESQSIRLKDLATVKTHFPDADFWLQRNGSEKTVGTPTKEFSPDNIGIKVTATDVLDPSYLYYMMMHIHNTGYWKNLARGSLRLVHISVADVANIAFGAPQNESLSEDSGGLPNENSLGQPIAQTPEALANFWRWFGDSKVVDDQERPIVVYHGTGKSFRAFDLRYGRGNAIYFTSDPSVASAYADNSYGNSVVIPTYLTIKNPIVLDETWAQENMGVDPEEDDGSEIHTEYRDWEVLDDTLYTAEEEGHDGAILHGVIDYIGTIDGVTHRGAYDQYIIFNPRQAKSSTGNRGTFSRRNKKITHEDANSNENAIHEFADQVKNELGLKRFDLYPKSNGDIELASLIVDRNNQHKGSGTEAMNRLVNFADQNNLRIVLSPAVQDKHHGTTSRARLVNFYKRFGFKENKGRSIDYVMGAGKMFRNPKGSVNENASVGGTCSGSIAPVSMPLGGTISRAGSFFGGQPAKSSDKYPNTPSWVSEFKRKNQNNKNTK